MVTTAEVEKVAVLAKLEFAPSEIEALTGELNSILGYIDQLKELDVSNIAPLENLNEELEKNESTSLRPDTVRPSLSVEEALRNAPKAADNYFLVPKVLASGVKGSTKMVLPEDEEEDIL